jgi:hypothetical protein
VVIQVADPRDDRGAIAFVEEARAKRSDLHFGRAEISTSRADCTFRELSEYRDSAFESVFREMAEIGTLDLNERTNRVELGILDASFDRLSPQVAQRLTDLGVAREAVTFVRLKGEPPRFDMAPPYSLQSTSTDPLAGGLQINYDGFVCSLGIPAVRDGVSGVITASHCSSSTFFLTYTSYPPWRTGLRG